MLIVDIVIPRAAAIQNRLSKRGFCGAANLLFFEKQMKQQIPRSAKQICKIAAPSLRSEG